MPPPIEKSGVHIERRARVGVTELTADEHDVCSLGDEQARVAVAQVVESEFRHAFLVNPACFRPHGVRVVTLSSGGVPESLPRGFDGRQAIVEMIERQTLLGRAATLEDVGNAAVFAASDWARSMTAAIVNVSCGALVD